MWSEFPRDEKSVTLEGQFMFGRSILVCPKLTRSNTRIGETPSEVECDTHMFEISCYLPKVDHSDEESQNTYPAKWYNWYSGLAETQSEFKRWLPDNEQGIFTRGGSIIPLM